MEEPIAAGKTGCRLSTAAAVILTGCGMYLFGYFLKQLSVQSGLQIWEFLLYEIAALLPIVSGGLWLNSLYRRRRRSGRPGGTLGSIVVGLVLVAAGILLFAFSSEMVMPQWRRIIISWQMLLVVIGIVQFSKADVASGITFLSVGTFFLIPRIDSLMPGTLAVSSDFASSYWPLLLAIFGVALLLDAAVGRTGRGRCETGCGNLHFDRSRGAQTDNSACLGSDGTVCYKYVFSGSEQVFLEPVFRGGSIHTVFGGMELDLRHTALQQGTTYLRVEAVFGGVEIKVPQEWNVVIESHSVFGGARDERSFYKTPEQDGYRLVIIANCAFGGCTVE